MPLTLCLSLMLPAFNTNAALAAEKSTFNPITASSASEVNDTYSSSTNGRVLDAGNWAPATRLAINNLIAKNGKNSPTYKSNKKPYVVFDWDNTNCYADVEESALIYQLENLKYKMTPAEFRIAFTSGNNAAIPETNFLDPYKNEAGQPVNITKVANDVCKDYQFFWDNYRGLNPKATNNMTLAQIKNSDQLKDFEAKFWFTYSAMDVTFGQDIDYTWALNFFTGYTPAEVKTLATQAIDYAAGQKIQNVYFDSTLPGETGIIKNSNAAIGNYFRQGLRSTPEMKNLMSSLRVNGVDVYICTASLDSVVKGFASTAKYGYNVPDENVIGMHLNVVDKKYVSAIPDTTTYAINVKQGKAVNINNLLAQKKGYNPILIAGDSDGDYEMMTELSGFNNVKKINDLDPLQMVLIVNRLKGGNIGALCKIAAGQMGLPNQTIVLQGRDEYTGKWVPYESTLKLGKTSYQLVKY